MARYMLIMRSTPEAEAAMAEAEVDFDQIIEQMGRFNEALINAGVLIAGEGLTGPEEGFVVDFDSDPPAVTDGPYPDANALFDGFWIIEVADMDEAKQWAQRIPLGKGVKVEARRVHDTADFPQDNPWVRKEIQWKAELAEKIAKQARAEAEAYA
ncbi:YciI family protein [Mycolicibacterium sp. XJ1819]